MSTSVQCIMCKHYDVDVDGKLLRDDAGDLYVTGHHCAAFPAGIPADIVRGLIDHRDAVDGDDGIRWEPHDGKPATELLVFGNARFRRRDK